MSADLLLGVPGKLKEILDRLTPSRAAALDGLTNLDAAVTSRATAADAATLLSRLTASRAAALDIIPTLGQLGPPTSIQAVQAPASRSDLGRFLFNAPNVNCPVGAQTSVITIPGPALVYGVVLIGQVSAVSTCDIDVTHGGSAILTAARFAISSATGAAIVGGGLPSGGFTPAPMFIKDDLEVLVTNASTSAVTLNPMIRYVGL